MFDNYILGKIEDLMRMDENWKAEYLLEVYCSGEQVTDATGWQRPKWQELLERWGV